MSFYIFKIKTWQPVLKNIFTYKYGTERKLPKIREIETQSTDWIPSRWSVSIVNLNMYLLYNIPPWYSSIPVLFNYLFVWRLTLSAGSLMWNLICQGIFGWMVPYQQEEQLFESSENLNQSQPRKDLGWEKVLNPLWGFCREEVDFQNAK